MTAPSGTAPSVTTLSRHVNDAATAPLAPLSAATGPCALPSAFSPVTCATPAAVVGDPCAAMGALVAVTEATGGRHDLPPAYVRIRNEGSTP